jgi:hypothetical protein
VVRLSAKGPGGEAIFQSGWFIESLLSQTLIIHMIRTEKIPFIQSRAAVPVLLLTSLIMAVGLYLPYSTLGAAVGLDAPAGEVLPVAGRHAARVWRPHTAREDVVHAAISRVALRS